MHWEQPDRLAAGAVPGGPPPGRVGRATTTTVGAGETIVPMVVPLAVGDWRAGARIEARAFRQEPPFAQLFPDERTRERVLLAWFGLGLRGGLLAGHLVETTATRDALAMWSPPGLRDSPGRMLLIAPRVLPQVGALLRSATLADLRRALAWASRIEQRHHELLPEPHWALDVLAVDPDRQRLGLGAVLAVHGLGRADRAATPTYVETNTERNVAFYRKLGFEVIEHAPEDYPPAAIPTWRMVRPPRPVGAR